MLNVLIAVEKPLWRKGFQAIFQDNENVRLWYAGAIAACSRRSTAVNYDVIVLCSNSSEKRPALRSLSMLKKRYEVSSFMLMAQDLEVFSIIEFCRAGVFAFVDEHATNDQIVTAVSAASRNDLYISSSIMDRLASSNASFLDDILRNTEATVSDVNKLSERELEALKLVARGMSNRAIAKELFISEKTVKNHLYSAYKKLGVRDRTQAAMAVVKGLLSWGNGPFGPT
ncbi:MAG TPA: response regulator transcription factor [Firmicutes bacterium]|nr:response regulator transcription factor [Candidatus Fermentithermobacillaceae bacterium]